MPRGTLRSRYPRSTAAEAAIGPVYDIAQISEDPQYLARESITTVDVSPTRVRMRYESTRDVVGQPAWLSIERRHVGLVAMAS